MTPQTVEDYLNNPNNFTNAQWENIQIQRKGIITKLESELGGVFNRGTPGATSILKKKDAFSPPDKPEKERKGKTRGARHNWIPVR